VFVTAFAVMSCSAGAGEIADSALGSEGRSTAGGGTANVTAINDLSGTLVSITNNRSLQATLNANVAGDAVTGSTTAINVAANTTGVTILQTGITATPSAQDPDTDGDGVPDSAEPILIGDIRICEILIGEILICRLRGTERRPARRPARRRARW
jgi:hypothetical protein